MRSWIEGTVFTGERRSCTTGSEWYTLYSSHGHNGVDYPPASRHEAALCGRKNDPAVLSKWMCRAFRCEAVCLRRLLRCDRRIVLTCFVRTAAVPGPGQNWPTGTKAVVSDIICHANVGWAPPYDYVSRSCAHQPKLQLFFFCVRWDAEGLFK